MGELGVQVPDGEFQCAHRRGAVAMSAGLFVGHGGAQNGVCAEAFAVGCQQRLRLRGEHTRDEAFSQQSPLGEAADRVEGHSGDGLSVADHVGHDGNEGHGVG